MTHDFSICFSIANAMDNTTTCPICFHLNVSLREVDSELVKATAITGCTGCGLLLSMTSHFFQEQVLALDLLVDCPASLEPRVLCRSMSKLLTTAFTSWSCFDTQAPATGFASGWKSKD